jgi:hypothetical protein
MPSRLRHHRYLRPSSRVPESDRNDTLALREAQAEVVRSREQLVSSGMALRGELRRSLEWRAWFRRAPLASLGLAFMAGFLWGGRRGDADRNR